MRDDQEKKTMNERIRAFYAQSGGPNNSQIQQIIEKHLLYGKDHGIPGKRETFKDAVTDVFLDDFSTKDMVMWLLKSKYDLQDRWQELIQSRKGAAPSSSTPAENRRLESVEHRLNTIEEKIETILDHLTHLQNKNSKIS